jgi:hypothetical protein
MFKNIVRYQPKFIFDYDIIRIEGNSILEDPIEVWLPFITKLTEYSRKWGEFVIEFKLNAFNTASSMYITNIINFLNTLQNSNTVTINWYCEEVDEDMEFIGEEYKEMVEGYIIEKNIKNPTIKFNIIQIK